ncbi:hypothetical protein BKA81DRAFT_433737 [Phyllosticta paracitricarpa]
MDMQEHEKKEREQEAKWEASMEAHRDYVAYLSSKSSRGPGYDVEDRLSLDMSLGQDGSLQAAYGFGPIEGTLLLDLSEEKWLSWQLNWILTAAKTSPMKKRNKRKNLSQVLHANEQCQPPAVLQKGNGPCLRILEGFT